MQYITIYQLKSGKWRAEVRFEGLRKTKVHATEKDAKKWAVLQERDFILNHNTEIALKKKTILTVDEALTRYSNDVSQFKKTAKKEMQRIKYFQNVLPHVD
ncbi:hypothetical protein F4V57_07630 [Acinetobacter qingfengensis]|uniref:Integrase n=1 Tax=Acinetobacter qingfengensis TaxID=1262585 RepID=A0A1E7RA04_9GAMM|nr:hypothetical protein [Acinetobacter qingfengensis]KAA8733911.1 hypothetical protein F4V57_07630 [Acinetobacter qingfengensis]OEY96170.1 hypothetical protein BJI46_12390 [Acinetobacter qingfengensis]